MSDRKEIEDMVENTNDLNFLINSQAEVMDQLTQMFEKKYDKLSKLLQIGSELMTDYTEERNKLLKDERYNLPSQFYNDLEAATQLIAKEFKKGLHKILLRYCEIQQILQDGLEAAAQYDEIILAFDSTKFKAQELKQKLTFNLAFMTPQVPSLISTSDRNSSSTDIAVKFGKPKYRKANILATPYRPLETEIITHIFRVIREMRMLRNTLNTRPFVLEYTNEAIKQSKLVVKMLAEQIPTQSMEKYLETLKTPVSQRL